MSERSSAVKTHNIVNHHLPHLSASAIDTYHVRNWINNSETNRKSADLMTKYVDLIVYQPSVGQVISRVPMILNLSEKELSRDSIKGLRFALNCWQQNSEFYNGTLTAIEASVAECSTYFDNNKIELYKAACLAMPKYNKEIGQAHGNLINTIRGLYSAGFTYSSIRPLNESAYYRKSA